MLMCQLNETNVSDIVETLPKINIVIDDQQRLELSPLEYIHGLHIYIIFLACTIVNKPTHNTECFTKL